MNRQVGTRAAPAAYETRLKGRIGISRIASSRVAPPRSIVASIRSKRSSPNQRSSSGRARERPIAKQISPESSQPVIASASAGKKP